MSYLDAYYNNPKISSNNLDGFTFIQEEEILNHKIIEVVNNILGTTISDDDKERLIDYITLIFREYVEKVLNLMEYSQSNNSNSGINIIYLPFLPTNSANASYPYYIQAPVQAELANPYNYNYTSQNPFNFFPNQMQLFQPPFLSFNQPMIKSKPSKKTHKKAKKDSKKTVKKDSKKLEKKQKDQKKASKLIKTQESEKVVVKEYVEGHEFDGLIDYLNQKCSGNAHLKGLITITSNGDKNNHCYNLIDKHFEKNYYPTDSPRSYVQFDFKEKKISVTKYSIGNRLNNMNKLVNWELVGSNDLNNWTQLDEQHIQPWAGTTNISTYSTKNHDFYRYIRLRLKGKSSSNNDCMIIASVEFFGKLDNCN